MASDLWLLIAKNLEEKFYRAIRQKAGLLCNEAKKDLELIEFEQAKQIKQGEYNANTNGC